MYASISWPLCGANRQTTVKKRYGKMFFWSMTSLGILSFSGRSAMCTDHCVMGHVWHGKHCWMPRLMWITSLNFLIRDELVVLTEFGCSKFQQMTIVNWCLAISNL